MNCRGAGRRVWTGLSANGSRGFVLGSALMALVAGTTASVPSAWAQDAEPVKVDAAKVDEAKPDEVEAGQAQPDEPMAEDAKAAMPNPEQKPPQKPEQRFDGRGRRVIEGPPTALAFKNVTVEDMISFIVEVTGKVVLPQQAVLSRKVTVLNDRKIPREEAFDLVVLALQQNGIAVVETDTTVSLRDIGEITRQDVPVIGPGESVLDRRDQGAFVEKVFRLRYNTAKKMGDVIKGGLPDFAKLSIDEESNQLSIVGNIALLQRIENLINSLDRPAAGALQTETFRMRYADAASIKKNIDDLFGQEDGQANRTDQNRFQPWARNQQQGAEEGASTNVIKVTANTSQNSVTVAADGVILGQIRKLIVDEWDQPLPEDAIVPRIYELKHSDPVKVSNLLTGLFGGGGTTSAARPAGNQGNQNNQQNQGDAPQAGQGAGRLAGQFTFQPIADAGRLVVIAKSPDNLLVIDKIIEGLDMPQTVGLPEVLELKHANAEDLAEQINALLAQEGTLAQIRRAEEGLSSGGTSGASPFATSTTDTTTDEAAATRDTLSFWWQRARTPTDRRNASNLIGLIRIVPVWRQNAIMIVAPPEYKSSIAELITQLDKPGRQVLISAIVAEVSREDAMSLGLRWGSGTLTASNPDNSISLGAGASGQSNNFASSLFDTSVLSVNTNVNVLLQALAQKTNVSILSEPKVFTSDNQEAEFFDGQDIPFVNESQTNAQGNLVQGFDYKAVGINLRARPRITVKGDVDLRVNLELSSIVPGETLFGGFVIDRRETTTQLVIGNGQTVVISGILREENTNIVRKVPLLGDIPFLGELFKSRDITKTNTELLVFITPVVINNTSENDPNNEQFIQRLKGIRTEARPNENKQETKRRNKDRVPLPGDDVFNAPVLPGEQP